MKKDGRLKKNLYLCGLKQSFMPMDKYAIYSYSLVAKPRRNELIPSDDNQLINDMSLEQRFELLFGQKPGADFPVQKIKKGGADKYPCHVVRHEENVVLLRLEKKKDVSIWEEQPVAGNPLPKIEKTTIKSTPYCYIIIDIRPSVHLIAIQSNSAAWRNPNDVKNLMQESMNWQYRERICIETGAGRVA